MNKKKSLPELSRLEQDVMNTVWDLGECTTAEVVAAFQKKRKLARTTIGTVLASLRKKGYVEVIPGMERSYSMCPVVSRESVARRSLQGVVADLFNNSPADAMACLIRDENVDDEELESIRRMIEKRRKEGKRS